MPRVKRQTATSKAKAKATVHGIEDPDGDKHAEGVARASEEAAGCLSVKAAAEAEEAAHQAEIEKAMAATVDLNAEAAAQAAQEQKDLEELQQAITDGNDPRPAGPASDAFTGA